MPTPKHAPAPGQLPLIHFVESDDLYLQEQPDALWFRLLRNHDWHKVQPIAARYYEFLWQFNQNQALQRKQRQDNPPPPNPETHQEATQRLLFARPTLDKDAPVLFSPPTPEPPTIRIDPAGLRPGVAPLRLAGRPPKCFFALARAFLGTAISGQSPEPEFVHRKLRENPAFARTCGFTIPRPGKPERQSDIPSLRKIQQFDQIMTQAGLWQQLAQQSVEDNLRKGIIEPELTIVHDTTHYMAYSSMVVVELPEDTATDGSGVSSADSTRKGRPSSCCCKDHSQAPSGNHHSRSTSAPVDSPTPGRQSPKTPGKAGKTPSNKNARTRRKSHPRTTKPCRCPDRHQCPHPWVNADDGAGTVVKSSGRMYWAHKASTLGFPGQEVLLDAAAISDAATHDSQSLLEHLRRLFQRHPQMRKYVHRVIDDAAADDPALKAKVREEFGIELLAPTNPRGRKPIRDHLPRGIHHLTASGVPVCQAGHHFELLGVRHDTKHFLFRAPQHEHGQFVCQDCPQRNGCYRGHRGGRQVAIPHRRLPWLDPNMPQLSKRFKKIMAQRTSIERLHKRMKIDFGDERLSKRGNPAFQALLDKTRWTMHELLAYEE